MFNFLRAKRRASRITENQTDVEDEGSSKQVITHGKGNMENVSNWSEEKVRNFLWKNNLIGMIPLCDGINGEELSTLYAMCKTNAASMYKSLKFELLHNHHRILPISTFLRFMSRMRAVCNDGLPSNVNGGRKTRKSHIPDDE
jgi:hypothetical protein